MAGKEKRAVRIIGERNLYLHLSNPEHQKKNHKNREGFILPSTSQNFRYVKKYFPFSPGNFYPPEYPFVFYCSAYQNPGRSSACGN